MAKKSKNKNSGTRSCTCSVCKMRDPSTVQGTRHRRCGGAEGAPRRPKHSATGGNRGVWS